MFVFYWFILLRLWLQDFAFVTLITPPFSFLPVKEKLSSVWSVYSEVRSTCTWLESFSIWNLHEVLFKEIPFLKKYKIPKQTMKCIHNGLEFFLHKEICAHSKKQLTTNLRQGLLPLNMFITLHVLYLKGNHCIWKALPAQLILKRWTWKDLPNKGEAFFAA